MNHRHTLAATLLALAVLAPAAARAQQVVPKSSEIQFVVKQMGVPVEGKFDRWTAQITLNPKAPEAGKVAFSIETASAGFGSRETDAEMPKAPWFNAAKFPTATFQSTAIQGLGGGKFQVTGNLVIKGVTKPVTVPVAVTQNGGTSLATGSFKIDRLAFKIGEGEWADTSMVASEVVVKFKLGLTGMAPL